MSAIISLVIDDLLSRAAVGLKKYGVTLDRTDLTQKDWLQHHYEELLDAACYVKKQMVMQEITSLSGHDLIELKETYFSKIKEIDNEFRKRNQ